MQFNQNIEHVLIKSILKLICINTYINCGGMKPHSLVQEQNSMVTIGHSNTICGSGCGSVVCVTTHTALESDNFIKQLVIN